MCTILKLFNKKIRNCVLLEKIWIDNRSIIVSKKDLKHKFMNFVLLLQEFNDESVIKRNKERFIVYSKAGTAYFLNTYKSAVL